jgi:uncharacterized protein (DUF362 family)
VKGKNVLIKPNFNTADPTPGSTHNDTLLALVEELWEMGAKSISLGERSYPRTRTVMEQKGILPIMDENDVKVIDFDDLGDKDWVKFKPKGTHWSDGFRIGLMDFELRDPFSILNVWSPHAVSRRTNLGAFSPCL